MLFRSGGGRGAAAEVPLAVYLPDRGPPRDEVVEEAGREIDRRVRALFALGGYAGDQRCGGYLRAGVAVENVPRR